jgi:uncharacterized membrane protein AbrB (regulator of aidB expression)
MGFPIGAAIGGTLAAVSLPAAVIAGVAMILLGTALGALMIPRHDPDLSLAGQARGAPNPGSEDAA